MPGRKNHFTKSPIPISGAGVAVRVLPSLATAEQIAEALQITPRTVHNWSVAGTIPTALRCGKVVRFHPPAVAAALGLNLPEFGIIQGGGGAPEAGLHNGTDNRSIHKKTKS